MYGLFTNSYPKKIPRAHGYELSNHSHRMGPCFLEISSLFFAKHWVTVLWECIPVGKWRKKTYCRGISPVYLDEIFRLSKVYAFSQNGTNLCHFLGHLISLTKQCLWCQKNMCCESTMQPRPEKQVAFGREMSPIRNALLEFFQTEKSLQNIAKSWNMPDVGQNRRSNKKGTFAPKRQNKIINNHEHVDIGGFEYGYCPRN